MKTPRQSIKLEEEQRQLLEEWVRAHRTPQQVVKRCQIILRSAEGKSDEAIAKELDINRHTCRLWRERFASCGADCLWEVEAGRGRKSQAGLAQRIIEATLHSKPTGQTHWTTRKMAKEHGVKPHRQKSFKLSRDPKFVEKLLAKIERCRQRLEEISPGCTKPKKRLKKAA